MGRFITTDIEIISQDVDEITGQKLDTKVIIKKEFCICGEQLDEFVEKFYKLVNEYRI